MRKLTVSIVLVVTLSLLTAGNARPAAAGPAEIEGETLYCDHIVFTMTDGLPNHSYVTNFGTMSAQVVTPPLVTDNAGNGSVSASYSLPAGTPVAYGIYYPTFTTVPSCSGAVTHFDPGDGRIDPKPGDRIAVYCNKTAPASIGVYGIDNNGVGIELENTLITSIHNAGKAGVTVDLGHLGTLFISGEGNQFWVDWNGPFNATSSAPFDKLVTCDF